MDPLLLQGLSLLALLGGYSYWKLVGQNKSYVRQLCSGLMFPYERQSPEEPDSKPGWRSFIYGGVFEGRKVEVHYSYRVSFRWPRPEEPPGLWTVRDELEIRIPVIQKFWLRMLPQATEEEYREEIIVDQDAFDRTYRIHANQREAATEFLQSRVIQERFQKLPISVDRLEIHQGWLKALFLQPKERQMKRSGFESILDHLILLTVAYERQSYRLEIKADQEISSLCPFCRSEMMKNEVVVECVQCSTPLHEACWKENKQCTTWGCNSTQVK